MDNATIDGDDRWHADRHSHRPRRRGRYGAGERLALTKTEFNLLLLFARNAGTVFERDEIVAAVHGADCDLAARSIDFLYSYGDLVLDRLVPGSQEHAHMIELLCGIDRASELVERLTAFGRQARWGSPSCTGLWDTRSTRSLTLSAHSARWRARR